MKKIALLLTIVLVIGMFAGCGGEKAEDGEGAIDFIFTDKKLTVNTYKVIRDTVKGIYPSDHYPIVAELEF